MIRQKTSHVRACDRHMFHPSHVHARDSPKHTVIYRLSRALLTLANVKAVRGQNISAENRVGLHVLRAWASKDASIEQASPIPASG